MAGFMFKKILHKLNYSNTVYKIFLFLIIFAVGTAITYGNWFVGIVSALVILMSKEIDEAYHKRKRDGHNEALNKSANEREK